MKGQRTRLYRTDHHFLLRSFWFYVLFINATVSNGALKRDSQLFLRGHLIEN